MQSPCVRQCCLDDEDVCLGCLRTLEEILVWGEASDECRRQILEAVACRQRERGATRGG